MASTKRKYPRKVKVAAVACGLTIGLLAIELLTRAIFPAPPNPYREPRLRYVADDRNGYALAPNQEGWNEDGWITVNSLGLRGDEPRPRTGDSVRRVLVLGDSLTFGWGVDNGETYCHILESLSKSSPVQLQVLNGGVSGYNTRQQRGLLERIGPKADADIVLLAFYWNDLLGPLDLTAAEAVQSPDHWASRLARHSRAIYCLNRGLRKLTSPGGVDGESTRLLDSLLTGRQTPAIEEAWARVEVEIGEIYGWARSNGAQFALMVLPGRQQVAQDYPNERLQSRLRAIGAQTGFPVIDPLPRFREKRGSIDSLFIPYDMHHYSPTGHHLVAEELQDFFNQQPRFLARTEDEAL